MKNSIKTRKISAGFYECEYNGFKFQICIYNPDTKHQWWGVTFINNDLTPHYPNDESLTKRQCIDDAVYMCDNHKLYGITNYSNLKKDEQK